MLDRKTGGGAVTASKQRTFHPLAVDQRRLEARSTASERAQPSTMHLQKTPGTGPHNVRLADERKSLSPQRTAGQIGVWTYPTGTTR